MSAHAASTCVSTPQTLAESKAAFTAGLVLIVLSPSLAVIFVGLRMWSRALMMRFGWDDGLIVLAMSLSIAEAGATWKFTHYSHSGYHRCDMPKPTLADVKHLQQWLLIQQLLYNPILAVVKASVLIFLMRFSDSRWFIKRTLQVFFVVNVMLGISIFFADLFQCTPIRYFYDSISMDIAAQLAAGANPATGLTPDGRLIKGGHCIHQTPFILSSAAITTFTEALTLLIPMAMVWTLKISRRKKIVVISILSLGWIVVGVSIWRIFVFSKILDPNAVDSSYGAQTQISAVEVNLAIIVACAPALKALTKRLAPRFLTSHNYGRSGQYGYGGYGAGYGQQLSSAGGVASTKKTAPTTLTAISDDSSGRPGDAMTIDERTGSQDKIMRPDVIEKRVEIEIEMDDLNSHDKNMSRPGQSSHNTFLRM